MPTPQVPGGPRPDRRFVAEPLERRLLLDASVSLVKDINAHDLGSYPGTGFQGWIRRTAYAEMNDVLYFAADDTDRGIELWRSDGTDAGTWLVKDIDPRPPYRREGLPHDNPYREGHGVPVQLRAVGSTLFFFARDAEHGSELWKSDGTAEGTVLVKDITPGPASSVIEDEYWSTVGVYSTDAGGVLYFTMPDQTFGQTLGLWRSDGTEQGTFRLADFRTSRFGGKPLAAAGGTVFFTSGDATTGTELW